MELTWLGVAGFKIDTGEGATLLIDPFLSRPKKARPVLPLQLADLTPVDEILLTNGRFDHSLDTPTLARQTGAIVHAAESICRRLAQAGVSNHTLEPITFQKPKRLGSLVWQALPSLVNQADSSLVLRALTRSPQVLPQVRALEEQWLVGDMVAYRLQGEGLSLVHFGSAAWIDSEIRELRPDIALIPVENYPNISAAAVGLTLLLLPRLVILHHWDDYYPPVSQMINLKEFEAVTRLVAPGVKVYIPSIGQRFNPADLL
ncbi:MAG: MBL fold metallo-hydrolase [Chloroflexota bacterium]